jgi:hypothetical protein
MRINLKPSDANSIAYLFYLADQDNRAQPILNRPFTLGEIFSNYSGAFSTPTFTPVGISANQDIGDIQSLFFVGGTQCLQPGDNEAFDQMFKITFDGRGYFPSTTIHISRGNFSGTLAVDRSTASWSSCKSGRVEFHSHSGFAAKAYRSYV